ncbi:MAG: DUF3750 domain-containing protein [Rhodospirillaceae bacterium]|nr:DUF3750 domain-containing protein [Rhodospirillaceae bacterium]
MTWLRKPKFWRWCVPLGIVLTIVLAGVARHSMADWRTASRESAGIAPDPARHSEAIVQVYAARAYSWRGVFGVHTWIAVKPTDALEFTVYEVVGWRVYHGYPAVAVSNRPADGRWFDSVPEILADMRGAGVNEMISRIDKAARSYPYMDEYRVWPGPNSNTFIAHVARAVPELKLDLPPTAIGKDFIPGGELVAKTPSGTGYQFSLYGLLGVMASAEEGLELNLLGLTFGVDPKDLSIKLPMAGRIGGSS